MKSNSGMSGVWLSPSVFGFRKADSIDGGLFDLQAKYSEVVGETERVALLRAVTATAG